MIYELRVYHCVPGRLPNLLKRFDTITLKLWEKHGIRQAGSETEKDGPIVASVSNTILQPTSFSSVK